MTNQITAFDGIRLAYDVFGNGSTGIIFVHGLGCNRHHWDHQTNYFGSRMLAASIDLAGHGDSGGSRDSWSMKNFARDVVAVADSLRLEEIVLVGHSMGGAVILEARRLLADRAVMLVGVDTFVYPVYQKTPPEEIDLEMAPLRADYIGKTDGWFRSLFGPDADPELMDRIIAEVLKTPAKTVLGSFEEILKWDVEAALKNAKAPISCVFSKYLNREQDFVTQYAGYFESASYIDCGHFIMLESPKQFDKYLAEIVANYQGRF